ncbi:tRNA (adenine(22)-N(1))-methyltransferase [Streptococcus sp. zg-JUN1979]|uniref:tRNA (adenine(22)-N(1))-methyltransferase n=1 Tax=Streptococcus sp. zg-JUN1979 TaxID=3391450 RepID=UPI0039A65E09
MEKQLSKRLEAVASYVPSQARLLDVGSDHAYLPIALVEQGQIDYAIAGEVVLGPYLQAKGNVEAHDVADKISVRLADGLAAFELSDAVTCITICGMGGRLITEILAAGLPKLKGVERLILQANNREDDLRVWLSQQDFQIVDEMIIKEHGKYYEIMVVEHGQMQLDDKDVRFGPYLRQEQNPIFKERWRLEHDKLQVALERIPSDKLLEKERLESKIQMIKEVVDEG